MAIMLHNIPKGHNWGWYSREDPRMHLQTVDGKHGYKVWLEDNGKRVFQAHDKVPASVLKKLLAEITRQRMFIEDNWVRLMLKKDWLQIHIALPEITLVAYPNYPHKFSRKFDLRTEIAPKYLETLTPEIIGLNKEMGSLRLWTDLPEYQAHDIRLSTILWQG
jgi:hypothetical protein